jgi:two-component system, sensor histidine kinase ChiS
MILSNLKQYIYIAHIHLKLVSCYILFNYLVILLYLLINDLQININSIFLFLVCALLNIILISSKHKDSSVLQVSNIIILIFNIIAVFFILCIQNNFFEIWSIYILFTLYFIYRLENWILPTIIIFIQILVIILNINNILNAFAVLFGFLIFLIFNEIINFLKKYFKYEFTEVKYESDFLTTKIEYIKLEKNIKLAYNLMDIIILDIFKNLEEIKTNLVQYYDSSRGDKIALIKKVCKYSYDINITTDNIKTIYNRTYNKSNLYFIRTNLKQLLYLCIEKIIKADLLIEKEILFDIKYNINATNYIYCDQDSIEKALVNLLYNSTKQAKKNTTIEIIIYSTTLNQLCINIIYKQDIIINNKNIKNIFDKKNYSVSDLDFNIDNIELYIAEMLIEQHLGSLLIKYDKQQDNKVLICSLPIKNMSKNLNVETINYTDNNILPVVMCIDDDQNTLNCVELILEKSYKLICFDSPVNALSYLEDPNHKVDILLIDLMMPEMYGINLILEIKNNQLSKNIPIILNSCSTDYNEIRKALELGVSDFIQKPFNKEELLKKLESLNQRA